MEDDKKEINYDSKIRKLEEKLHAWDRDIFLQNFLEKANGDCDRKYNRQFSDRFSNLRFNLFSTLDVPLKSTPDAPGEKPEKFNDLHWGGDNSMFANRIVTCTDKGRVLVFNTDSREVVYEKSFGTGMLNACAIEQKENQLFAAGGFDGTIFVKNIKIGEKRNGTNDADDNQKRFIGHFGGISTIRFLNTSYMLSASYDSMIILWDLNSQGKIINIFKEHTSEVSGLDVCDTNGNIFASGSGDTTAKLWDLREKKACVASFQGCDSSINCVKFLPGRISTIAAGSEDSTIKIFDYRAFREIGCFSNGNENNSINSVFFSKSGCLLFATVEDKQTVFFWDLFGKNPTQPSNDFGFESGPKENGRKGMGGNKGKLGFTKGGIDSSGKKIAVIQGEEIHIFK